MDLSLIPALAQASQASQTHGDAAAVLSVLGDVLEASTLESAARAVAARLVAQGLAQSVAIALCDARAPSRLKLLALSDAATIDEGHSLTRALLAAMDECLQQRASVCVPNAESGAPLLDLAHNQLARLPGCETACSVPLASAQEVHGVMTLMGRPGACGASGASGALAASLAPSLAFIEHLGGFIGPALALKQRALAAWGPRLGAPGGPTHLGLGLRLRLPGWQARLWAAAVVAVVLLAAWPVDHQINAPARLHGRIERALVAPQDGYLAKALVKPGDRVRAGQVLAEFELDHAQIELRRLQAEWAQAENAFGEAVAKHDRGQTVIQQAHLEQARAKLDLLLHEMEKSRLIAPFDGLVLSGDLSRSVGAVVKRGEALMTLAPEDGYRLMLWVDERDIDRVAVDQTGRLLLSALSDAAIRIRVSRITPMAQVREGANGFEVEAQVLDPPSAARPGLEGIAKLDVARAPLAWWGAQRLVAWTRSQLWAWVG